MKNCNDMVNRLDYVAPESTVWSMHLVKGSMRRSLVETTTIKYEEGGLYFSGRKLPFTGRILPFKGFSSIFSFHLHDFGLEKSGNSELKISEFTIFFSKSHLSARPLLQVIPVRYFRTLRNIVSGSKFVIDVGGEQRFESDS